MQFQTAAGRQEDRTAHEGGGAIVAWNSPRLTWKRWIKHEVEVLFLMSPNLSWAEKVKTKNLLFF